MAAKDISEPKWRWLFLLITCCILVQAPCIRCTMVVNCSEPTTMALLKALGPAMNLSSIRPVVSLSTPTNVSTWFTLYGILGVDEKAQVLTTYIWLNFVWESEFFSWDQAQCGTDKISLPRTKFWVPDVVINEFMDENSAPSVPYIYLHHTGKLRDAQPVRVVSSCNLNIYTFPFDVQNCSLTFNSYIHHDTDIKVNLGLPAKVILDRSKKVMATMGEWELLDIKAIKYQFETYDDDNDTIDELSFHIVVGRRATMYVVNLLIPSCFLITVDLFSFLLPPQSVDRSSFKMTLILGYTVFLLIMNDLLPVTGNTIPLINVFFSICLALMVASLLETVIITNLLCSSNSSSSPVPHWIRVLVLNFLGCLVFLPPNPREDAVTANPAMQEVKAHPRVELESQSEAQLKAPGENTPASGEPTLEELRKLGKDLQAIHLLVDQHLKGDQNSGEWIQVGYIIDRLLFSVYILFISASFITIVCIWVRSYSTGRE